MVKLRLKHTIILSFLIISISNCTFKIEAQCNHLFLGSVNFQYWNFKGFTMCHENSQSISLTYNLSTTSVHNYIQPKLYNFSCGNIDTLLSSVMYNRSWSRLMPPDMEFHYTPTPTTLQGLGILFMGITKTVLFPTASD